MSLLDAIDSRIERVMELTDDVEIKLRPLLRAPLPGAAIAWPLPTGPYQGPQAIGRLLSIDESLQMVEETLKDWRDRLAT